MMTLTHEDLDALKAPFAAHEHEFLRGFAYIREDAITERIETVDPAWHFRISNVINRDGTISVVGSMTIKDVTRENIGMAQVATTRDGNSEANEAEKSAATDALKRCARLFGIGRYLLSLPDNVKNESALAHFLGTPVAPTSRGNGTNTSAPPAASRNGASTSNQGQSAPRTETPPAGTKVNTMLAFYQVRKNDRGEYYVFKSVNDQYVTVWSWTNTLEPHGWDKDYFSELQAGRTDIFDVKPHIGVTLEANAKGYWEVVGVTPAPAVEPDAVRF